MMKTYEQIKKAENEAFKRGFREGQRYIEEQIKKTREDVMKEVYIELAHNQQGYFAVKHICKKFNIDFEQLKKLKADENGK